ncbi:phage tail tip lysozyme [Bordetella bronchialis]|uniref:Phage tail lysozyme domain-containing protein n=1 Tax=Bordetella bronchialis TaxID=463025 RepID=A0A193FT37_9BORD|nr:phage tail tip lysozyme [Bordetella bronchialis]ANN70917.1 hypothetical protein BAU08_05845 [Bordetella bronchialis]
MANDLVFRITAVDNATKVAKGVRSALARVTDPIGKLTNRLARAGRLGTAAFEKAAAGMQTVALGARTVSDRIASIIPGMTALTGLAGTAGIGALAERWGNLGFRLASTSRQLGMSTQSLQAWHYAAQRAGVTAEQFDQSMLSSQNTIREAAFGANPQAMMLLSRLGVQISKGKDGQIDYQKTQQDILTALQQVKNPAGQRTAADALGVGALLPMIQRGTFNADRQRAVANGYAPSEDAIQRAAAFRDRLNDLSSGASALANTIGDKLVPVLTPMVEKLSAWLSENRVDIANRFADAVGKFTAWINSVDWGGWYDRINKVVDAFGGWGSVLRDIVALKIAGVILGWSAALLGLVANLGAAATAMKAFKTEAAVGGAGGLGFLGKAGLAGVASEIALEVAKQLGLPDVNKSQGEQDVQNGNWWAASTHLSAGDFLTAARDHIFGNPGKAAQSAANPQSAEIMRQFMAMGVSRKVAAGLVGNAWQESHDFNPHAVGDGGQAYGMFQWHPDRQANFARWAGHDIRQSTREEQMQFKLYELRQQMGGKLWDRINSDSTAAEVGADISRFDQRPGTSPAAKAQEAKNRAAYAQAIYDAPDAPAGAPAAAAPGATPPAPSAAGQATAPDVQSMVSAFDESLRKLALHINVSAPAGTRVETAEQHYSRITYAMPGGNLP